MPLKLPNYQSLILTVSSNQEFYMHHRSLNLFVVVMAYVECGSFEESIDENDHNATYRSIFSPAGLASFHALLSGISARPKL